jgi:REP element-mobilizing transposase RayT
MSRGNRRAAIFEDDLDRLTFLSLVGQTVTRYELTVDSLCLMRNHYHFICETPRGNISDAMQFLNGGYAQFSNRRHRRTGHVFEGRFRSLVIEREGYLRRAIRYSDLNPVRAGLVSDVAAWQWSTYRATAGLRPAPRWLSLDWLELAFDATTRSEAQRRYRAYVNQALAKTHVDGTGIALGSPEFRRSLAAMSAPRTNRALTLRVRMETRPALADLFAHALAERRRRDETMRLAHESHGYYLSEIARHLGLDRSCVSKVLRNLRLSQSADSTT